MNAAAAVPAKPHQMETWGILPDKRRTPHGWPACPKKQSPRVAFRNNDIYMVNNEESDPYKEPQERNIRVLYKLKMNEDPTLKNMPNEEEFDDDNYESIEKKKQQCKSPLPFDFQI